MSMFNVRRVMCCTVCNYTTHRRTFMEDHKRIHTGEKPHSCDICGKAFAQKSNMKKHMMVHNTGPMNHAEYECDQCDFTTKYKQSLTMHENWHKGLKPYRCDICDLSFSQATHRRTHMLEIHSDVRQFSCNVCEKKFKRKEHLDKHMIHHRNERPEVCDICQRRFNTPRNLAMHMLVHGGEKTKVHKCELCPYKTRYKQALKIHYYMHLGVRPYKCQHCPKAFRTSQVLKIHTRMVHEGEAGKIFQCEQCKYASAHKQTLKSHVLRIHMGVKQTKSHRCPVCSKIYLSASSLHNHKRKKHPIQLKQERMAKMREKLKLMKKIGASPKRPKGKQKVVDDYRYSLMNLTARAAVQRAKEMSYNKAKREAMRVEDEASEAEKLVYIKETLKASGDKKEEKPRTTTGRKKHSKYMSMIIPKQEKAESDSDCEFYSLIEKDCGNSLEVGCNSERGDVDALFEDESKATMSIPWPDDTPEASTSSRKSSRKRVIIKQTASEEILPDKAMEGSELKVARWIMTVHQSIIPDSDAIRWQSEDATKPPVARERTTTQNKQGTSWSVAEIAGKVAADVTNQMNAMTHDDETEPSSKSKEKCIRPRGRPRKRSAYETVNVDTSNLVNSELQIIKGKHLIEPPNPRNNKRSDPTLNPRLVQKRKIARRDGHTVIYADDPLAALPTVKHSKTRVLTIAQRLENELKQLPPGTEVKKARKPDISRNVLNQARPVQKLMYSTLSQRVPIPNPPKVPKTANVMGYDSLRSLANDYITVTPMRKPEPEPEPEEQESDQLEPLQVLPLKQEPIWQVKEEVMDYSYDDAQPSTSSGSAAALNISAQFTQVKKRRGRKKKAMITTAESVPVLDDPLQAHDVQRIIANVHKSENLVEVNQPEVVEEVEELVEYIDVKQEPVDEVLEELREVVEIEEETVHDLRHFSYANPIKIEPADPDSD